MVLFITLTSNAQAEHTYEFGACEHQLLWTHLTVTNRAERLALQMEHLDAMHTAGVNWIRLGLIYKTNLDSYLFAHIKRCNELGIKVLIILSDRPQFYPSGTKKRPGSVPAGQPQWDCYRLSDLDLNQSEAYVRNFFTALVNSNATIQAIEIFSEINWNCFNGDLPIVEGGLWIDENTPWDDPVFTQYRAGISKVAQLTKRVSDLNDEFFGGAIKIITAGLVAYDTMNPAWFASVKGGLVAQELTLQLMHGSHPMQTDTTNYLQYVDGIGMHTYPSTVDYAPQTALREIAADLDPLLVIPGAGTTKPFWITECGYPRSRFGNNETNRFNQLSVFYNAFDEYDRPKSSVGAVFHYCFSAEMDADQAVWDHGNCYKSADVFKTAATENTLWTNRPFDAWQVEHFGDHAHLDSVAGDAADFDHDGICNLTEYAAGSDPSDSDTAANALHIASGPRLTFTSRTNDPKIACSLQWSPQLVPAPSWQTVTNITPTAGAGAGFSLFACDINPGNGFYRLRISRAEP